MRHNLLIGTLASLLILLASFSVQAQTNGAPAANESSVAYLMQTFPRLTQLYRDDLAKCHTHYIFAVDVSGSMVKYDSIVTPAIKAFVMALPIGEQVSVIPFGTDAKENIPGLCCKIQGPSQKQTLLQSLSGLYTSESYSAAFRHNTDIDKAVSAINKTLLNNQEPQMNVIVIITDFLNDLPNQGEVKLTGDQLKELNKNFDNVTGDCYTRVVALKLPPAGSGNGYCLDQLQNEVFCNTSTIKRFDVVPAIKDQKAISYWFNQLSRDIMTDKLRAVIQLDNKRSLNPTLKTKIDIDGNTTAEIRWTPNKFYKQIKIDSTYVGGKSDFVFDNNKKAWKTSNETVIKDLKLGRIKHKSWGFWPLKDSLNIGLSLPTEYDDELQRLSIDKPIPNTSSQQDKWLFTFCLPLWLTALLAALLLLYLLAVIKAFNRNRSERFVGTVEFYDNRPSRITNAGGVVTAHSNTFLIGGNGTGRCRLIGAPWTIRLVKKTFSPFLFWKKPIFEWSASAGIAQVRGGKPNRGLIGRYNQNGSKRNVTINCGPGPNYNSFTHNVKISININKKN